MEGRVVRGVFALVLILILGVFVQGITITQINSPTNNSNLSSGTVLFNATANPTNASAGVKNVSLYLDGVLNATNSAGLNNTNYTFIRSIADGNHTWFYKACDVLNTCVNSGSRKFLVDTVFPTLSSSALSQSFSNGSSFIFSPGLRDGKFDNVNITMNSSELIYDWGTTRIFHENGSSIKSFGSPSGFPDNLLSNSELWDGNYSGGTLVPDGRYSVVTQLKDVANNTINVSAGTIFVDNTPPQIISYNGNVVSGALLSEASGSNLIDLTLFEDYTLINSTVFNLTNISNRQVALFAATNTTPNDWNYTINTSLFKDGKYNLTTIVTDSVGNVNKTEKFAFIIDNIAPNTTINFPTNNSNLSLTKTLNATVQDVFGIQSVVFNFANTSYPAENSSGSWINSSFNTTIFADGFYDLNVTATDFAGNVNQTGNFLILVDNNGPTITIQASNRTADPIYNNISITINATINDTFLQISSIWISADFEGVLKNYSVTQSSGIERYFTINFQNLTNQEIVSWQWFANDSLGNVQNNSLDSFMVQNRDPIFNATIPIADLSWIEDSGSGVVNLSLYFYDEDNDDLNWTSVVNAPSPGDLTVLINDTTGIATILSAANFNGVGDVTFTAHDGVDAVPASANLVTITVTPEGNNEPTLTTSVSPANFTEDSNLNFVLVCNPNDVGQICSNYRFDSTYSSYNNSLKVFVDSVTGNVLLNATKDYYGLTFVKFSVDDDGFPAKSGDSFLQVNVTPINDAPIINISNQTISEDSIAASPFVSLSNYVFDVDNIPSDMTWAVVSQSNPSLISCSISGNALNCGNPTANQYGVSTIIINVTDGNLSAGYNFTSQSFFINVTNVNDNPTISSSPTTSVNEDSAYSYQINATDVDNFVPGTDILTYSFLSNPSGMNIDSNTGLIIWFPTQANVGNNNVAIKVDDGKGGSVNQTFTLAVNNVNDIPTTPILLNPTNASSVAAASINLQWNTSTDADGNTVTYFVFFSNNSNPTINTSTTSTSVSLGGLQHGQNYYWHVIASDLLGNATKTETRTFNVSLKNAPTINSFSPANPITILEGSSQLFSISASDIDVGDILTYNWSLDGNAVGTNTNNFNFTTNFSSMGTYTLNASVSDSFGLVDSQVWTVIVTDNGNPAITSSSPTTNSIIIKQNTNQAFNIVANDPEGNPLTYRWFVNSVLSGGNSSSFNFNSTTNGNFNVTVSASDSANNFASREWGVVVSDVPIANTFTGDETTDLTGLNLNSVAGFTLENAIGKITFNENVNLTDVLDLDNSIIIQDGIIAVDSSRFPQLNKRATITLSGVSYTTFPRIFTTSGFTNVSSQINQICDFCDIISFTNFPTTNGEIIFEVEHFSSFLVGNSGSSFDISSLQELDKCILGLQGNLDLNLKNPNEDDEFEIGDSIDVDVEVENNGVDKKNIVVETTLYNINDDDEESDDKEDESIKAGDEEEFEFNLEIPEKIDDGENYILYVKAFEKGNEANECSEGAVSVSIEREEHKIQINSYTSDSTFVYPGNPINVYLDLENIGSNDEEARVTFSIAELGITRTTDLIEIEEFDEDNEAFINMQIKIPEDAKEGKYNLNAKIVYDKEITEQNLEFNVFKKIVLGANSGYSVTTGGAVTTSTPQNPNTYSSQTEQQFDTANKYLVWMILLTFVLILFILIFRR